MRILSDTKFFLQHLLNKPASINRRDNNIAERYIRSLENKIDNSLYFHFIDRLCRSLSFTTINDRRKLVIDTRGKNFIFLKPERAFEVIFFGWIYYFPWYHLFPYGKLGDDLEAKCDEIMDYIKGLPADEALEIDNICSELLKSLDIFWKSETKEPEDGEEKKDYSNKIIEEKILCWGIRHMILQPLSWFEFLGFHDMNMDVTHIKNAEYIVITPFGSEFLSEKNGIVI
jgi:hypothetical protein